MEYGEFLFSFQYADWAKAARSSSGRFYDAVPQRYRYVFQRHLSADEYEATPNTACITSITTDSRLSSLRGCLPRNTFSASFFLKGDTHTERGIYPGIAPFPLIEPTLRDGDIQTSIGLQDTIRITSRLSATAGFSADHFDGLQGQAYNSAMTALLPFTCIASPPTRLFPVARHTFGITIRKQRFPTRSANPATCF